MAPNRLRDDGATQCGAVKTGNRAPWGADMRKLTATIASLALAGSLAIPAPAAAETSDLARALAGIAAIAIIAKAIDNRRDRKRSSTYNSGNLGSYEHYDGRRTIDGTIRRYDNHNQQTRRRGFKRHPLPQSCLRVIETSRGDRLAYGARCVNRKYEFASRLPESCETVVRTPRGFRTVYGARCLRRDGWKVARR